MKELELRGIIRDLLKEGMSNKEFEKAKEADRLSNHPEREKIQKIQNLIKKEKGLNEDGTTDWYNIALDLVGLIPGLGEPADLLNTLDYLRKGDYLFAALSAVSMIPEIGDAVGKGGKILVGLTKALKVAAPQAKKLITLLRSNKDLINKIFDGLEDSDKVPDEFKNGIPKMKEALETLMQESLTEDEEDERANFTDDDWENFYLDKDLAEVAGALGYLNEWGTPQVEFDDMLHDERITFLKNPKVWKGNVDQFDYENFIGKKYLDVIKDSRIDKEALDDAIKNYLREEINEYGEYKTQETEYRQELDSMFGDYRPFISLGKYAGGRPDSDPLKGKGFGEVSFNIRDILPEDEWRKALDWVKSKGFEIQSESNDYEMEFDGDRAWYPTIKFHFDANKFDTE